jgi:hypothetical protein
MGAASHSWATPWRFDLMFARGRSFRDPDPETLRRALHQESEEYYFAVLSRPDHWYLQVGYGEAAGRRPGWAVDPTADASDGTANTAWYRCSTTDTSTSTNPGLPRRDAANVTK